jgi:hypothetical protein
MYTACLNYGNRARGFAKRAKRSVGPAYTGN